MNGVFRLLPKEAVNYVIDVSGVLTISVQNKLTKADERTLEEFLDSEGITTYDLQVKQRPVACSNICAVGSELEFSNGKNGTLGGFAFRQLPDNSVRVCALTAYHVAKDASSCRFAEYTFNLSNILKSDSEEVDLAAFDIQEDMQIPFDGYFRGEHGEKYIGEICPWEKPEIPFKVYKRGAKTGLTTGRLVSGTATTVNFKEGMSCDKAILIRGTVPTVKFGDKGDSGSLVHCENTNGNRVKVIGVVVGIEENGYKCWAQLLDHGLDSMRSSRHGNFSIYNPSSGNQ